MQLSIYNDTPSSQRYAESFRTNDVLQKLRSIDRVTRRKGLAALDPAKNRLVALGCEFNGNGRVTKNSYGVFSLAWEAAKEPGWPAMIEGELREIRSRIREAHGVALRYVIWAGMGGSAEDKAMYQGVGLLKSGPRFYILDSTDPEKLSSILADIAARSKGSLADCLRSTLVVGMAMGMTSYEPVVNLEKLAALYDRFKIDSAANFVYMTLPGSLLDKFGSARGYRKVDLQPDGGNSTAGRHSAPMTRGSLYPLGLAGVDLAQWIAGAGLSEEDVQTAWRLAAFLHAQSDAQRDKVTLLLPREWSAAALWTKQDFEESLGKSDDIGLKIVIGEKLKMANYRSPRDPAQERVFLVVQKKGSPSPDTAKLRRSTYPLAVLTLGRDTPLSAYMQFVHYAVFGLGFLRNMNFVTQPSVELYKAITGRLFAEAGEAGGLDKSAAWMATRNTQRLARWKNALTLRYDKLPGCENIQEKLAPEIYAAILKRLIANGEIEYGELTFFGDTRYSKAGKAVRKSLDRAAELVYRSRLRMPADVYEGPAMNHSYHEMIIGHGKCLSTVLISERGHRLAAAQYTPEYHRAQFLATQMALAERGRHVVSITLKDIEDQSLSVLDDFFRISAGLLK